MPVELLPQALCKVEDVKELMTAGAVSVSSKPDDLLVLLINLFTSAVEGNHFLNSLLLLTERTDYFDGGGTKIWLPAAPIALEDDGVTPRIQVWDDPDHVWDSDTELTLWDDFGVRIKTGCIILDGLQFEDGSRSVKVTWHGGMVTANDPTSAPYDLRMACAMQVLNWYQRKSELGLDALSIPTGGSIQMTEPSKLLRFVYQVVLSHRRFGGPFS